MIAGTMREGRGREDRLVGAPRETTRFGDEGMDVLYFFKERTAFIRSFFEDASSVFVKRMSMIENGEHPYDTSGSGPYEDDEPLYLSEWTGAREAIDVLGLACVSMLAASLHAFLLEWEGENGIEWEQGARARFFKRKGVKGYVRAVGGQTSPPLDVCPADLDLIEQTILARNAAQHPETITDLIPHHRRSDLKKHPRPFFMNEFEGKFLEGELADISFLVPQVRVSGEQLRRVLEEAEKLAAWLDGTLHSIRAARWGERTLEQLDDDATEAE